MYEIKKIGKVMTSKSVGTGPSSYEKKNLPGRGLTKVEKQCCRLCRQFPITTVPEHLHLPVIIVSSQYRTQYNDEARDDQSRKNDTRTTFASYSAANTGPTLLNHYQYSACIILQ